MSLIKNLFSGLLGAGRGVVLRALLALMSCFFVSSVGAQSTQAKEYVIKPRDAWVTPIEVDVAAVNKDNQTSRGVFYLLADAQVRIEKAQRESYRHFAIKALNEQGLDQLGHVEISFDPSYQKLSLHTITLRRAGRAIDKLKTAKIQVLQREKELEARIYDGSKTANVFLEDVQVGDVLEYSYTISGSNPVFKGRQSGSFDFQASVPVHHLYNRLVTEKDRALHFTYRNAKEEVRTLDNGDMREYVWENKQVPALIMPSETPQWHDPYPFVQWSDYRDWATVAQWATPLYQLPAQRSAAIQKIVDKINAEHRDPAQKMMAALLYVQKEIRYLGVEIGMNSHAPNPPDLVLSRRFGDCKDKTLLTLTLLQGLGIKAWPALVHTSLERSVALSEPTPFAFNHVIVHATLDGKEYWLDPTRSKQVLSANKVYQPNYGFALIIDPSTTKLKAIATVDSQIQRRKVNMLIDTSAGFDQPSKFQVTTVYEGVSAESMRNTLRSENREDLLKRFLNFYAHYYPSVEQVEPAKVVDDEMQNRLVITENYVINKLWTHNEEKKRTESSYYTPEIESILPRPGQPKRNQPYALGHPIDIEQTTEIRLPSAWKLKDEDATFTSPAFEVKHRVKLQDDKIIMIDHYRSLKDHLLADEMAKHTEAVDAAKNALGLMIWQVDTVAADEEAEGVSNESDHSDRALIRSDMNWVAIVMALLFAVIWIEIARRWYCADRALVNASTPKHAEDIGGWLILFAIGIVITPLRILWGLKDFEGYGLSTWLALMNPASEAFHPSLMLLLIAELGANIGFAILSIVVVIFFFKRSHRFPRAFLGVFWGIGIYHFIDLSAAQMLSDASEGVTVKEWAEAIRGAVYTLIWSLYVVKSERVKQTFVRIIGQTPPPPPSPMQAEALQTLGIVPAETKSASENQSAASETAAQDLAANSVKCLEPDSKTPSQ